VFCLCKTKCWNLTKVVLLIRVLVYKRCTVFSNVVKVIHILNTTALYSVLYQNTN